MKSSNLIRFTFPLLLTLALATACQKQGGVGGSGQTTNGVNGGGLN